MKKLLALALTLMMVLGLLAACGGDSSSSSTGSQGGQSQTDSGSVAEPEDDKYYNESGLPIVKEPITINVVGWKDGGATEWNDLILFQRAEESTGIHFEFELYDDETVYYDKMNLGITTGDYPDVYMRKMSVQAEETNGMEGTFIDLTDLIANHMPNLSKLMEEDAYLKAAMTAGDGKIYSLPYYYKTVGGNPHQMFMFEGWLNEAGWTELPTTVDEFYDLLVDLDKLDINGNGDPSDDIALGAWDVSLLQKFLIPAFTGYTNGFNFDLNEETGEVVFVPLETGYREFLEYTHKLYAEKLLDQEIYTQSVDQWLAKLKENRLACFNASPTATDAEKANGKALSFLPLTSDTNPNPVTESMPFLATGAAVITDKCEYPEAVARWFDMFYARDDESMDGLNGRTLHAGWLGEHWFIVDEEETQYKWNDEIIADPTYVNAQLTVNMWLPSYLDFQFMPTSNQLFMDKVEGVMNNQVPYMRRGLPVSHMRLTTDEMEVRNRVAAEAETYAKQMTAQFITGVLEINDANWNTFVSTFETMGVQDLIDTYQVAYERFDAASN